MTADPVPDKLTDEHDPEREVREIIRKATNISGPRLYQLAAQVFLAARGSVTLPTEREAKLEAALREIDDLASTKWADEVANRRTIGMVARTALAAAPSRPEGE